MKGWTHLTLEQILQEADRAGMPVVCTMQRYGWIAACIQFAVAAVVCWRKGCKA